MKKLSIIIVNYNSGEELIVCIKSIRRYLTNVSYEIIVVDNNSTDNSRELLKEYSVEIKTIILETNTGFSSANNYGVDKSTGEYLLLLNPDTILIDSTLKEMIKFLNVYPDIGVVGPFLIGENGENHLPPYYFPLLKHQIMEALFIHNYYWKYKKRLHQKNLMNQLSPFEVDWISGACFLFVREVFTETGGLDERFHLYAEDVDWCKRIRERGWKIYCYPKCKIVHLKGTSTHKDFHSLVYNRYKSKRIYVQKHYTPLKYIILHFWVLIGLILRLIVVPFRVNQKVKEKRARLKGYVYSIILWIGFGSMITFNSPEEKIS